MSDTSPVLDARSRLTPIQIGPVQIDEPVLLAPMSGVSDLPFRKLVSGYGAGLVMSEMIASQAMIYQNKRLPIERSLYYLEDLQEEKRIQEMYFIYIQDY